MKQSARPIDEPSSLLVICIIPEDDVLFSHPVELINVTFACDVGRDIFDGERKSSSGRNELAPRHCDFFENTAGTW